MNFLTDTYGRQHTYLRISLTDKCNMHCSYCRPLSLQHSIVPQESLLSYEELIRVIRLLVERHGVSKIRVTGGEPLIRKDVLLFFKQLYQLKQEHPFRLGITTNGIMLSEYLPDLKSYGVDTLNISLDSLRDETFLSITATDTLQKVLHSIQSAKSMNFSAVKINMVVMKGINDNELIDFADFAVTNRLNVRFIEFMPFTKNGWNTDLFIGYREMKSRIESKYTLNLQEGSEHDVAKDYGIAGTDGTVSFISSVSEHFCGGCNRLRITASGILKSCLFSTPDMNADIKSLLRQPSVSDDDLSEVIESTLQKKWKQHPDESVLASMEQNSMTAIGG